MSKVIQFRNFDFPSRHLGLCWRLHSCHQYATAAKAKVLDADSVDWKGNEVQMFPLSTLGTYYFQKSLPRLPVPTLQLTTQRYLDSIQCILTPEEFKHTKALCKEFEEGDGPGLQSDLTQLDKSLKGTSYISAPWFDMYLSDRQPLPINYNPALVFVEDPVIDSLPKPRRQLTRTTNLLVSALRFMKSLDNETLEPEVYHMNAKKSDTRKYRNLMKLVPSSFATYASYLFKAFPLDMSQYNNLFRSTRVPRRGKDNISQGGKDVRHIVVMRRGHLFSCPVLDSDGDILPVNELMGNLESILNSEMEPNEYPLGIMTTQERNKWADVRERLVSTSQRNSNQLEEIDSALFVLCLDDCELGTEPVPVTRNFLHSDGSNRWFDKSFQMILTKDAWAGVTFEHAWGDGVAVLRFFNDIHRDSTEHQWSNSLHAKRPALAPIRLVFDMDETVKGAIKEAKERLDLQTEKLDIHPFILEKYGKSECKKWKISPDSLMQLGFQVAYYRMYHHTPASYESCSTAAFKHGRTETIRPATNYTKRVSELMSKKDWTHHKSELKELMTKCSEKHNQLTKDAAMGQGFDRHLFALRLLAEKKGNVPGIFQDAAYGKLNRNIISTSTLASPAVRIGAFGPVLPDGFGLGYQIWEGGLGCITATYRGKRDGAAFVDTCNGVFTDFQTIMDS